MGKQQSKVDLKNLQKCDKDTILQDKNIQKMILDFTFGSKNNEMEFYEDPKYIYVQKCYITSIKSDLHFKIYKDNLSISNASFETLSFLEYFSHFYYFAYKMNFFNIFPKEIVELKCFIKSIEYKSLDDFYLLKFDSIFEHLGIQMNLIKIEHYFTKNYCVYYIDIKLGDESIETVLTLENSTNYNSKVFLSVNSPISIKNLDFLNHSKEVLTYKDTKTIIDFIQIDVDNIIFKFQKRDIIINTKIMSFDLFEISISRDFITYHVNSLKYGDFILKYLKKIKIFKLQSKTSFVTKLDYENLKFLKIKREYFDKIPLEFQKFSYSLKIYNIDLNHELDILENNKTTVFSLNTDENINILDVFYSKVQIITNITFQYRYDTLKYSLKPHLSSLTLNYENSLELELVQLKNRDVALFFENNEKNQKSQSLKQFLKTHNFKLNTNIDLKFIFDKYDINISRKEVQIQGLVVDSNSKITLFYQHGLNCIEMKFDDKETIFFQRNFGKIFQKELFLLNLRDIYLKFK